MGYIDTINSMERDYKNGRLLIVREGDMVKFSGSTYNYKGIIKGMGPRNGGATWNSDKKQWSIAVSELYDGDLGLLSGLTDGQLVQFVGYEGNKPLYVWH